MTVITPSAFHGFSDNMASSYISMAPGDDGKRARWQSARQVRPLHSPQKKAVKNRAKCRVCGLSTGEHRKVSFPGKTEFSATSTRRAPKVGLANHSSLTTE
jgi:hypothetical protein